MIWITLVSRFNDRDRLILEHIDYAKKIATIFWYTGNYQLDRDELSSIALLALVESAARYDRFTDTKFTTYTYRVINNALIDFAKKQQ